MGFRKVLIFIFAILTIIVNQMCFGLGGDSVLHPESYKYKWNNMELDELKKKIDSFFDYYAQNHIIIDEYSKIDKKLESMSIVHWLSIGKYIDHLYSVYFYAEKKIGLLDFLFVSEDKDDLAMTIFFSYIPRDEIDEIDYETMFSNFINEFENFTKDNNWNVLRL